MYSVYFYSFYELIFYNYFAQLTFIHRCAFDKTIIFHPRSIKYISGYNY